MMVSGTAGTGKTSIGAMIVDAACARGEKALLVSLEESPSQLVRNMRSIGVDLQRWRDAGLLEVRAVRPTAFGSEEHLALMYRLLDEHEPSLVVLDAISGLGRPGAGGGGSSVVSRDLDLLKSRGITAVLTTLAHGTEETSDIEVSSLIDTWLLLRNHESNGERNRLMFVIKSRGTAHSNQVREFLLTDHGAELVDVYVGPDGVLTGSARVRAAGPRHLRRRRRGGPTYAAGARSSPTARTPVEAQIAALRKQLADETAEFERLVAADDDQRDDVEAARAALARTRSGASARDEGDA